MIKQLVALSSSSTTTDFSTLANRH